MISETANNWSWSRHAPPMCMLYVCSMLEDFTAKEFHMNYDLSILRVSAAGPIKVYNYNKISGQDNIITSSRDIRELSFDTVTELQHLKF